MAKIKKCDFCPVMDTTVLTYSSHLHLSASKRFSMGKAIESNCDVGLSITLPIDAWDREICLKCFTNRVMVPLVLPLLSEILKPYQPERVVGFIQGVVDDKEAPELSDAEARQMLALLSRKLLKA